MGENRRYFTCSIVNLTYHHPNLCVKIEYSCSIISFALFSADRHGQLSRKRQNSGIISFMNIFLPICFGGSKEYPHIYILVEK